MPTSDDEAERHRWWLLRWGPRHESGVIYRHGHEGEVWVGSISGVVPVLVSHGDFAPADMQYRMHREHLWDPETGLYGERYDVDTGEWIAREPTAIGNASVAAGIARALRAGGDTTPAEMRGRWQRETTALLGALESVPLDGEAAALVAEALGLGVADGWLDRASRVDT